MMLYIHTTSYLCCYGPSVLGVLYLLLSAWANFFLKNFQHFIFDINVRAINLVIVL
ncbi:hypothetical protein F383_34377 [Gossypium arboreum]|uniref:Uncharacterized protein n=1 Tax=Gossypium arboreum TaxID=29729 RepID=A0A0B0PU55_GOSAR|nr:hypothetical protein F383_34377 [Gossypium arboreum]